MSNEYIADQNFERIDYKTSFLPKGEYDNCHFVNCDFSGSDLSDTRFLDCIFTGCNLSVSKIHKTSFRDVRFRECKMMGLRFDTCDKFAISIEFDTCTLDHSSFYQLGLKKTIFRNSTLREVDFTGADLSSSVIDNCDLKLALFENTILEKADLRRSYNYSIDPTTNKIRRAKFSLASVPGLLDKFDIDIHP
jgi:fluoroquinolone resistance protein